ncbi:arrestin homolog [Macrobrachium rosenbergii]|uniref:arrestin homolog n=1 Tax=Macrobrachium rosenbergii TaxID=79674 RepID=UPI0034D53DCD
MAEVVKVFKKTSPNGKVTAYLGRRDFVDHLTHTAPISGAILVDDDYLKGRKVFAKVTITFRYGREEDEVMGLHFTKEYELVTAEITPKADDAQLSAVQTQLIEKLGASARPFSVALPENAPASVTLEPGDGDSDKPLGVLYELMFFVGESEEENPHRQNSVAFSVRKVQFAPSKHDNSRPYTMVSRTFTLAPGHLNLEIALNQDIYLHGQPVETIIKVVNKSKRTVKSVVAQVIQHVEVTMTNSHFSRVVASIESREGCPITPDSTLERSIELKPLASNMRRFGVALDGRVKDMDANLASSTVAPTGKDIEDALGIIVSYSVRMKLLCGAISGNLSAEVPFKLMHPDPEAQAAKPEETFEVTEFSSIRRGKSVDEVDEED